MPATTFPQAYRPKGKQLHWLMRCGDSSTRTDVRASENEHIFAIIGTSEARRPCAIARHSPKTEAREHTMARLPSGRPSHACAKKPHRLRNGDAALAAVGGPRCCQTTSRTPLAGERTEFQTAQATSIRPRSRRRAWGPRCLGRWAAYSRRWPRSSPGYRGARARARRAACRPRHARLAAA